MTTALAEAEIKGVVDFTRGRDWYDPTKGNDHVTLVGVGGVGSPTAFALAKMGIPNLTLIDPDVVDQHNIPNQVFEDDAIGYYKVGALAASLGAFMPTTQFSLFASRITEAGWEAVGDEEDATPPKLEGVVISGLDSMKARHDLWHKCIRYNLSVPLYLDARLDQENIVIYAVNPINMQEVKGYEATLYSDDDAKETTCTRQSIMDVGFAVGALLARATRRHLAGEEVDRVTYYDHQRLSFMTGNYNPE